MYFITKAEIYYFLLTNDNLSKLKCYLNLNKLKW